MTAVTGFKESQRAEKQGKHTLTTRENELTRAGWKKRSTLDEPRLSEVVQAYREIDFEIHLEPFHFEEGQDCVECMKVSPQKHSTVYTRIKS